MRYVHTNIITDNWQRLADFYISVFGCEIVPPRRQLSGEWLKLGTAVKSANLQGVHLRLPGHGETGPTLEIFQYSANEENLPTISNRKGFGHIAFEVENVEQAVTSVLKGGGKKYGEIVQQKIAQAGLLTFTYVKDPDGNIIELQHWE